MTTRSMRSAAMRAALLLVCLPVVLAAQQSQRPEALRTSDVSLSFGLPSGGGPEIGVWFHPGSSVAWGFVLQGDFRKETTGTNVAPPPPETQVTEWSVLGGPQVKFYFATRPNIAPHLLIGALAGYSSSDLTGPGDAADAAWEFSAGGTAGLGVDWFPLDRISIGGAVAVRALYITADNGAGGYLDAIDVTTLTSALRVQIYF